jgi:uncharacterized protein YqjF (DUF2071 family)
VERRLLVNYSADPEIVSHLLPAPFAPQLVNGRAVVGICLIRLGELRPRGVPKLLGLTSENAAHRMAVQWRDGSVLRTGVYIPRRHSSAGITVFVGDRLFPGVHERADFEVSESADKIAVALTARGGDCRVDVAVTLTDKLADSDLFASTAVASEFFRAGSKGFSPSRRTSRLDGLDLVTDAWCIEAASIDHVHSSLYDDPSVFPVGSIALDSALVMRGVPVEWHSTGSIIESQNDG